MEDPSALAVDADMGVGDADVDDDGFVGLFYPPEVVDGRGISDTRDGTCM